MALCSHYGAPKCFLRAIVSRLHGDFDLLIRSTIHLRVDYSLLIAFPDRLCIQKFSNNLLGVIGTVAG